MKKLSYSEFWLRKGTYGETRVARMLTRKLERHERRSTRMKGNLRRGRDGRLEQICSYQPMECHGTMWCEYPCNGDC